MGSARRSTAAAVALATAALAVACAGASPSPPATLTPAAPTPRGTATPATATTARAPSPGRTPVAAATPAPLIATPTPRPPAGDTCSARFPGGVRAGDPVPAKVVCIDAPPPGATVPGAAGARVCVSGFVAGAFEQNVVIEVRDDAGRRLALAPATAFGADLGLFATRWEIEIRLADDAAHATGRVVAYTTSPRDGSIETRAEVPVRFAR